MFWCSNWLILINTIQYAHIISMPLVLTIHPLYHKDTILVELFYNSLYRIVMGVGLAVVAGGRHVRFLAAGDEWPHTGEGCEGHKH